MQSKKFIPDEKTKNIVNLMLDMVDVAEKFGKKIFVGGGLGLEIEAALGRGDSYLTRDHGDLDIHPMEEDVPFWKEWFQNKGYLIKGNDEIKDNTKAFVAFPPNFDEENWGTSPQSFYADIYGIFVDKNEFIHSRESGKDDNWKKEWNEVLIVCSWNKRKIIVLRHELALHNKYLTALQQGKMLREKDIHDHGLFGVICPVIFDQQFVFKTDRRLFSPDKLDLGTRFLLENTIISSNTRTILDLGCGWGAIGTIIAKTHPQIQLVLTDNDPVALKLARENIAMNGVSNARVIPASNLSQNFFDIIFSNLPWHKTLTAVPQMIKQALIGLKVGGKFYAVTNKQYRTQDKIKEIFGNVEIIFEQLSYKILESTKQRK